MIDRLFYWNGHKNFGDELSLYLVQKISNQTFRPAKLREKKLVAIGSLLNYDVLFSRSLVWGTGILRRDSIQIPKWKLFPVNKFLLRCVDGVEKINCNCAKFFAVRGPLTAREVSGAGFFCPNIYGDPAVTLPMFYKPLSSRVYPIGLILHHSQEGLFDRNLLEDYGVKSISILREGDEEIERFVDEVCSCERIFSTSLHGVIVAQAYGIPVKWITFDKLPIHGDERYKFYDYFLGVNQEIQEPLVLQSDVSALKVLRNAYVKDVSWKYACDGLLDVFPIEMLK